MEEWLALGIARGWIGKPVCWVHECPQLTEEEQGYADRDDLDAICISVVRLYAQ